MKQLSNGQYTKIKAAIDGALRCGPDFQWRFINETLHKRDIETFLIWARDQLENKPQPHAAATNS